MAAATEDMVAEVMTAVAKVVAAAPAEMMAEVATAAEVAAAAEAVMAAEASMAVATAAEDGVCVARARVACGCEACGREASGREANGCGTLPGSPTRKRRQSLGMCTRRRCIGSKC